MQSTNYIVIQGWMCNELNLKGNELLVFALIYGFSQDGQSRFFGSRNYIADTFNISLPTVDKAIEDLTAKNLIMRHLITDQNGTHYEYTVCKETLPGVVKNLYGGGKDSLPYNTSKHTNNKDKVLSKDNTTDFEFGGKKPRKQNLYSECISLIRSRSDDPKIQKLLIDWLNMLLEKYKDRDKQLYVNVFKGKLNMLYKYEPKEWEEIIQFAIQRGYEGFYPVTQYTRNNTETRFGEVGVKSETYTTEELEELRRIDEERERNGLRTKF